MSTQAAMDSEDEVDQDVSKSGGPAADIVQRRRAQKAIFDTWLVSSSGRKAIAAAAKGADEDAAVSDDQLSMQALMNKVGTTIIGSPRDYQLELFERAKQENTIAVLDTGSGKTLIAVLLLRWVIEQELERPSVGVPPRVSFFLVDFVTLAYQQHAVLETNLPHKILKICGEDGPDSWTRAKWEATLHENQVIVCTADVLQQCLARSYVSMRCINLLIFDEAHHAKKNHPYARIIKDFYLAEEDEILRPRIFGMTASPIDAKTDVIQAAHELETLLHSKIATTLHMDSSQIKKPAESILRYAALPQHASMTPLLKELTSRFGHLPALRKLFAEANEICRQLGGWCADEHIRGHTVKRQSWEKLARKGLTAGVAANNPSALDKIEQEIKQAFDFINAYPIPEKITEADFSSKISELYNYLNFEFERPSNHRCIVFVVRRHTARLLANLFQKIGTKHMRCGFLVGAGSDDSGDYTATCKTQVLTLHQFRQGQINCLFATSVAEEGLDVPDCNLVVRFDMYNTMIQYVQSRGRARERNSRFVHMVENGNTEHEFLHSEVRCAEAAMRKVCQSLPEDRKLGVDNDETLDALLSKEQVQRTYTDLESGAKLTYGNCLSILANFVSAIPNEEGGLLHPSYVVTRRGNNFMAEVILPGAAPMRSKIGKEHTRKGLARRAAAFDACVELREKKYLNENLLPIYQKRLPTMRNALLAANIHKRGQYSMRAKPSMWAEDRGTLPEHLWVTVIDFTEGLERKHRALALLTRRQMPDFPRFPIFLNNGRPTGVASMGCSKRMSVDPETISRLSSFTFRVFQDVFSKKYEEDPSQLSYWLAPVQLDYQKSAQAIPEELIDWQVLDEVFQNQCYPWTIDTSHDFLNDKFLVDPWDGSRKFFSGGVEPTLKPSDPVPEGSAKSKRMNSILEYTVSLFKKASERATWNPDQPVLKTEMALLRRNFLAPPEAKEVEVRKLAYVCPEPLKISALPADVATACFVFPSVIHRLESYLIALEACNMVGISCEPVTALAAITKDSDNSGDHEQSEKINFQKGMGDNYERLEFIGDTFLKTATSISTFIQNPNDDEYHFHVKRMLLLCNKNLFNVGVGLNLPEYIRSRAFSRAQWYPEGLKLLVGKGAGQERKAPTHDLGQKTIADVSEALIGAAFLAGDNTAKRWTEGNWEIAVHAVTKLVGNEDHMMEKWDDYRKAYKIPNYQLATPSAAQRDTASKIALEHPYNFQYPTLLRSAFIHPSTPFGYESLPNYQRLEFLGDALLDQASITWLFNRFPEKDPQWLTEHKMAMVSNKFLGAVCVNTGFYKHLRYTNSALEGPIREYANELMEAKKTSSGSRDYWTTVSDPPKCLPDIVESYVGAMFIDSDFDYSTVQDFFEKHILWYFEDMSIYDTYANNHPCTHLHNLLQTTYGCQDYRLMARELPPSDGIEMERKEIIAVVMIHDQIIEWSKGKSGRYARLRAASKALDHIKGLQPVEFRTRYGCNCHLQIPDETVKADDDCAV